MALHQHVMLMKEELDKEVSLLADRLAQLKTATGQERREVFREHHHYIMVIADSAQRRDPITSPVRSRAGTAADADSGDLRNVVSTIEGLPVGFNGKMQIYINDHNPKVSCRNFLILQILSQLGKRGLDLAIAVWYSLAITEQQAVALTVLALKLDLEGASEQGGKTSWSSKDNHAVIEADFDLSVWAWLFLMMSSSLTLQAASNQRSAKLKDPSRRDHVDNMRARFRPYHRVAIEDFRDFGLLLPYGAFNAHHVKPNTFLLDPFKGYTLDDLADPRDGWETGEILAAGAKYGVPKNDLYGALFFLLRDKLGAVVDRMKTAEVTFEFSCKGASELAARLKVIGKKQDGPDPAEGNEASGEGVASNARGKEKLGKLPAGKRVSADVADLAGLGPPPLHRIDVSNICDPNYVGVSRVLRDWGSLLFRGGVLVGLFMNWTFPEFGGLSQEEAMSEGRSREEYQEDMLALSRKNPAAADLVSPHLKLFNVTKAPHFAHDFSTAFNKYLKHHGAYREAEKQRLILRDIHQIVPPRFRVPVDASKNRLPIEQLTTVDDCYWGLFATSLTGTEVYTEWVKQ